MLASQVLAPDALDSAAPFLVVAGVALGVPHGVVVLVAVAPLAALGVYFGAWHALRHTARLVEVAAGAAPASSRRPRAWAARAYLTQAATLVSA